MDLKPCPFCGSENIKISHKALGFCCEQVRVYCEDCSSAGATGSAFDAALQQQAIDAWNRRV